MTDAPKIRLRVDELALYATEAELAKAILGKRARDWKMIVSIYERRGFPRINTLMCGRNTRKVLEFFDKLDDGETTSAPKPDPDEEMKKWRARKPRVRSIKAE